MQGATDTNMKKVLYLPSETWGNGIYDSISDIALRFLSSTFILSTNLEAPSTQAPFFHETIYPCHWTIWNLSTSSDPHKSVLDFHNAPEIFPNYSQDLNQTSATSNHLSNLTIYFFNLPISLVIFYLGGCLCACVFCIYSYNGRNLQ